MTKPIKSTRPLILMALFISIMILATNVLLAQSKAPRSKERMDMIKKMKMLDAIELDEAKSEKFLLKYNSHEKEIEEIHKQLHEAKKELNDAIKNKSKDIASKTNSVITLHEKMDEASMKKIKEMKSVLTDIEYAKYVDFEHKFMHELMGAFMGKGRYGEGRQGHNPNSDCDSKDNQYKQRNNKKK